MTREELDRLRDIATSALKPGQWDARRKLAVWSQAPNFIILLDYIDRLEREAKAGLVLRANLVWSDFSRTHQAISTDVAMYDAAVAATKETGQ